MQAATTRTTVISVITQLAIAATLLLAALALLALVGAVRVDALGLIMSILSMCIATVVLGYSRRHLRADERQNQFAIRVAAFAVSLAVLAWANDLLAFTIAWIVSGRLLAALVGHVAGWSEARAAAERCRRAFLLSDLALVTAMGLLVWWTGTIKLSVAVSAAATMPVALTASAAALLVLAAAVRSALPPFSGWLLGSMAAPTPVSALMHGGFVNAAGFLLIRFSGILEQVPQFRLAVAGLGVLAAMYGIGVLMVRPDIKGALAGSTVSQMGFMIVTCGLGAYGAALWHLVAHGLFKAWLFLETGSTIGFDASQRPKSLNLRALCLAAGVVLAAVAALRWAGAGASALPLGLASGAAVMTMALLRGAGSTAVLAAILLLLFSLGAATGLSHLAPGVQFAGAADVAMLIAAAFAIMWIVQAYAGSRGLPRRLFASLLNSGVLTAR